MSQYGDSVGGGRGASDPRSGRCRLMVWDVSAGGYKALSLMYGRRGLAGYRIADADHPASVYDELSDAIADVLDEGWSDEVVIGDEAGNVVWRSNESLEEHEDHRTGK